MLRDSPGLLVSPPGALAQACGPASSGCTGVALGSLCTCCARRQGEEAWQSSANAKALGQWQAWCVCVGGQGLRGATGCTRSAGSRGGCSHVWKVPPAGREKGILGAVAGMSLPVRSLRRCLGDGAARTGLATLAMGRQRGSNICFDIALRTGAAFQREKYSVKQSPFSHLCPKRCVCVADEIVCTKSCCLAMPVGRAELSFWGRGTPPTKWTGAIREDLAPGPGVPAESAAAFAGGQRVAPFGGASLSQGVCGGGGGKRGLCVPVCALTCVCPCPPGGTAPAPLGDLGRQRMWSPLVTTPDGRGVLLPDSGLGFRFWELSWSAFLCV